jgi:hypothetical protein
MPPQFNQPEIAQGLERPLSPLEALAWLQNGGGLSPQEAEAFRKEVQAERQAQSDHRER